MGYDPTGIAFSAGVIRVPFCPIEWPMFGRAPTFADTCFGVEAGGAPVPPDSLLDGLLAFYRLSDNADESSGQDLNLAAAAGVVTYNGTYATFDGSSYLSCPTVLLSFADFTISCFVNFTDGAQNYGVLSQSDGVTTYQFLLRFGDAAPLNSRDKLAAGVTNIADPMLSLGVVDEQAEHNVVLTWRDSTGVLSMYIDGVLSNSAVDTGDFFNSTLLLVGHCPGEFPMLGTMRLLGFWGRALTTDEIGRLYNGGDGYDPTDQLGLMRSLNGFYRFDGSGDDASGHGRDLFVGTGSYSAGLIGQALSATTALGRPNDLLSGGVLSGFYSLSMWARFGSGSPDVMQIVVTDEEVTQIDMNLQLLANDISVEWAGGSYSQVASPVSVDAWHHFVFVVDGGEVRIYVDGIIDTTGDASGHAQTFGPAANFTISVSSSGGGVKLDLLAVYARALSADDVAALYNGGDGFDPTE